ncbi:hypothetical protein EJB05_08766, partial [Eragrostis curvula]
MKATTAFLFAAAVALLLLGTASAESDASTAAAEAPDVVGGDQTLSHKLKIIAGISILVSGAVGCSLPVLGKRVPALHPQSDVFFLMKAFAAGVILATGLVHILPDAFEKLGSEILAGTPWRKFPFAGLGAMLGALGTLIIDTVATGYFTRRSLRHDGGGEAAGKAAADVDVVDDVESQVVHVHGGGHQLGAHTHATHGHAHGGGGDDDDATGQTLRHRVICQVLEFGIVVHSIIIGISLGASQDVSNIKPLMIAICFHQLFEGIGLGGCITQANFKLRSIVTMVIFFCLTTPFGVLVGFGISSRYNENSPAALIVEGLLNSVGAGILIYMALVDLLAEDFKNKKVQSKGKLHLGVNLAMLTGAALMSVLAIWA